MAFVQFVQTTAGAAAVASASPTGPFVNITSFQVGSGYNYTPVASDTALHGTVLYTGTPTSYYKIASDTIAAVLTLPADVGPFDYGEIGLFIGSTLFALATYQVQVKKLSSIVDGVPHTPRIHALIKLAQAPAIFQITTTANVDLLEVPDFTFVAAPDSMVGTPNSVIVHEPTSCGDSVLLYRHDASTWVPERYTFLMTAAVGPQTPTTLESTDFANLNTVQSGRYLIRYQEGYLRSVSSAVGNVATLTLPVAATGGATVDVFEADCARDGVSTYEVLPLWSTFNSIWGAPSAQGYGWGQTPVPYPIGQEPTSGEWLLLTTAVGQALNHIGKPAAFNFTPITPRLGPDRFAKLASINRLYGYIETIYQNRLNVPTTNLDYTIVHHGDVIGPWQQHHLDIDVSFTSETDARAFFNAGGCIAFVPRSSRGDYVYSIIQRYIELLGHIHFSAERVFTSGPLSVNYRVGDGIVTDGTLLTAPTVGYYGLLNTRRKIFSWTQPFSGTPSGRYDEAFIIEMFSTRLTASSFRLEFWVTQTAYDAPDSFNPSALTNAAITLNETLTSEALPDARWPSTAGPYLSAFASVAVPRLVNLPQINLHLPTTSIAGSTNFGTLGTP